MTYEIIMMCGIPASGKSYWANKQAEKHLKNGKTAVVISRDDYRKELVGENPSSDEYFSREKEVFDNFIGKINTAIHDGVNYIFVDATHVSHASRHKLLSRIEIEGNIMLRVVVMLTSYSNAIQRNGARSGFACVPNSAIASMLDNFSYPTVHELIGYGFRAVLIERYEN
jgi:predicted kinase